MDIKFVIPIYSVIKLLVLLKGLCLSENLKNLGKWTYTFYW